MKKFIRLLLKIPVTPFFLLLASLFYIACTILLFFEWLYEVDKEDRSFTKDMMDDMKKMIKKWFTTI
jgi:hypothetical protein